MNTGTELIPVASQSPPPRQLTFHDLVTRFISSQDISQASRVTQQRQLKQFTAWLEETGLITRLDALQREDILTYRDHLLQDGKSAFTVNGYMTAVRKLFEWLEGEKIYPNIARGVKGSKKPKGFRKDCLTPGQVRDALNSIDRSTLEGLRDYALFNLLARTGLRTIEIIRAQISDVRQEGTEALLWIQGKGRDTKDEFVLLVEESLKPLREYIASRGTLRDDDPLFASVSDRNHNQPLTTKSVRRIVKEILRRVNLDDKRFSAHSLRHTAISLSIRGGASLEQAQAMARHTDPKTTMIYFHNIARIENGAEKFIKF